MRRDSDIIDDWKKIDSISSSETIQDLSRRRESEQEYLLYCLCAECGVSREEIAQKNKSKFHIIHYRWLFWYAYRYMTNESFLKIAEISRRFGHAYDHRSIRHGVDSIGTMIAREPHWARRWEALKHIIMLRNTIVENLFPQKITIQIPH